MGLLTRAVRVLGCAACVRGLPACAASRSGRRRGRAKPETGAGRPSGPRTAGCSSSFGRRVRPNARGGRRTRTYACADLSEECRQDRIRSDLDLVWSLGRAAKLPRVATSKRRESGSALTQRHRYRNNREPRRLSTGAGAWKQGTKRTSESAQPQNLRGAVRDTPSTRWRRRCSCWG